MNFWTIVAVGFSALFTFLALGNLSLKSKPAAVFIFLAGIAVDVYLLTLPDTMPDFMRFMWVFLMFFQLFSLLWVYLKGNSSQSKYRRY